MAAVAGSKGRISYGENQVGLRPSHHVELLAGLLAGGVSLRQTAAKVMNEAQLREVGIDTNMVCNLDCHYCYLKNRPEAPSAVSVDVWTENLAFLAAAGVKLFAFIGKEPLADNTALDVLHRLNALRQNGWQFRTGMVTNGTLVQRHLQRIATSGLSFLDISLDHISDYRNELRGTGLAAKVKAAVETLDQLDQDTSRSVACVLHGKNVDGFEEMVTWIEGLSNFNLFASPVLDFTGSASDIDPLSVSPARIYRLIAEVGEGIRRRGSINEWRNRQIVFDLPYSYSWAAVLEGAVDPFTILEDRFEAQFIRPDPSLPIHVKLNLLPLSYWRAARITHDGRVIENMDLAAHAMYQRASRPLSELDKTWIPASPSAAGLQHMIEYLGCYFSDRAYRGRISDRFVGKQFNEHLSFATT